MYEISDFVDVVCPITVGKILPNPYMLNSKHKPYCVPDEFF